MCTKKKEDRFNWFECVWCGLGRQYLLAAIAMGVLLIVIDTAQDWTQSVWKLLISLCDSSDDLAFIATHAFAAPSGMLKKCKIKFSVYNSLLIYETNSVLGKHYVKVFRKNAIRIEPATSSWLLFVGRQQYL